MQELVDRLAGLYASSPLLLWVACSVLAYALLTNVLWLVRPERGALSRHTPWIREIARFLFFLGVPYLALGGWPRGPYRGLLSLESLGIVGLRLLWPATRWLQAAGTGVAVGLVALLFLLLAWAVANRRGSAYQLSFPPRPWWALLVDALYLEVHWAFYRAALSETAEDLYVGVFVGLGVVYLEWALNPFWRQGWRVQSQAAQRWLRAAMALVVAVLFLLTGSLWICLGVHWLIEMAIRYAGRERAVARAT